MAIKPTTEQIDRLADQRMIHAGVKPPVFSEHTLPSERERRTEGYEKTRDQYRDNARLFLERVDDLDQGREAQAADRDTAALDAQVSQLRTNYLAQSGATDADFDQALPRLLERQRETATLAGRTDRERAMEAARASGRYSI